LFPSHFVTNTINNVTIVVLKITANIVLNATLNAFFMISDIAISMAKTYMVWK
jgi:hypothetical protein